MHEEILRFWFEDTQPAQWWEVDPAFDALLRERYAAVLQSAAQGECHAWRGSARGRLAEIIVLDQFSRQLYRGRPEAFASDGMALVLAQEAVAGGHHHFIPQQRRMFMLMPYMHAESPEIQAESVRLFTALGVPDLMPFATGHADCIREFGRFPRRNAALGRTSTPAEIAYMAAGTGMF